MDEDKIVKRAFTAYSKSGANMQPANTSGVRSHGGRNYVVLENAAGPLAVFRIQNDGILKSLKRWPKAIE